MSSEEQILSGLFKTLWDQYYQKYPHVRAVYKLILDKEKVDSLFNDHIALRTFGHPRIGLEAMSKCFTSYGFEEKDSFHLKEKGVFAKYYKHPSGRWPRVFISELILEKLSDEANQTISSLVDQIPDELLKGPMWCTSGVNWKLSKNEYKTLLKSSEYASWMSAHGFQMNHATVSVNNLKSFNTIEDLNIYLKSKSFELNGQSDNKELQVAKDAEGREVLKQSSIVAGTIPIQFSDGVMDVPGCYYEFIQRFHDYDSFDPGNASKIMESTNVRSN